MIDGLLDRQKAFSEKDAEEAGNSEVFGSFKVAHFDPSVATEVSCLSRFCA